jgi:hypothetical protein
MQTIDLRPEGNCRRKKKGCQENQDDGLNPSGRIHGHAGNDDCIGTVLLRTQDEYTTLSEAAQAKEWL